MNKKFLQTSLVLIVIFCFMNQCSSREDISGSVRLVADKKAKLGEGAIWDYKKGVLYWIDIEEEVLYDYDPETGKTANYQLGSRVGTVVPVSSGGVLLALEKGIYKMDFEDTAMQFIAHPEKHIIGNRYNDGKCDPAGRFWVGSMSTHGKKKAGALYCLDKGNIQKKIDSVGISNGIVWSGDKTKMYYIDTPTSKVKEFFYNNETGEIIYSRIAVDIPKEKGYPDGMAIDVNNNLWIALWSGGCVTCWNPDNGELIKEIEVPAVNVTSCAFGGKNLDLLYITTARQGMNDKQLAAYPLSGGLFVVNPGVKGVNNNHYVAAN